MAGQAGQQVIRKGAPVELSNEQVVALFRELGGINAKVDALSKPGAVCSVHGARLDSIDERIDKVEEDHGKRIAVVEAQQTKQNLVAAAFGAIAGGVVLALKLLFSTSKP
jgi:hypothetical protein